MLVVLFILVWSIAALSFFYDTFQVRERHAGLVAQHLIDSSLLMPLIHYQYHSEKGDALVTGILAVPFFLIFGNSYISLKLVGIFLGCLTVILWFIYANNFFGKSTAAILALLLIFCPATLTKVSLISWGGHGQANFYIIIALLFFSYIHFRGRAEAKKYLFLLFGLFCGLSLYATKIFGVFLLATFIFWVLIDRKVFAKVKTYIFGLGLLIGYSPGIYYNILHKNALLQINMKGAWSYFAWDNMLIRLQDFLSIIFKDIPSSFMFFNDSGNIANYIYYFVFLICVFLVVKESLLAKCNGSISVKGKIFSFSLIYFILFCLVLSFSNLRLEPWDGWIGYRYLMVLYPFIFLVIAYGLSIVFKKINNKILESVVISFFIIFLALGGNLQAVELARFNNIAAYKGYTYSRVGWFVAKTYLPQETDKAIAIMERIPDQEKPVAYEAFGFQACINGDHALFEIVPLKYKKYAYKGFGSMTLWAQVRRNGLEEVIYKGEDISLWPKLKQEQLRGFDSTINLIPQEYRADYLIGIAKAFAIDSDLNLVRGEKFFRLFFDDSDIEFFYRGFGEVLGERFGNDRIAHSFLENVSEEAKQKLKAGLEYGKKITLEF